MMITLLMILSSFIASADTKTDTQTDHCEKVLLAKFDTLEKQNASQTAGGTQASSAQKISSQKCFALAKEHQATSSKYPFECEAVSFTKDSAISLKVVPYFKQYLDLQKWTPPDSYSFDELNKMIHSSLFAPVYTRCLDLLEKEKSKARF